MAPGIEEEHVETLSMNGKRMQVKNFIWSEEEWPALKHNNFGDVIQDIPVISLNDFSGVFLEETSDFLAINLRSQKISHLHFYFHDIQSGKNPRAIKIISPGGFADTFICDDALTIGPNASSKVIGRAQGIYSMASQSEYAFLMAMNFEFIQGKYNGSSISILGRNPVNRDVREMPIVGGTGLFRFARGYALAHTVWFNVNKGDAIVEYNVFVQHF